MERSLRRSPLLWPLALLSIGCGSGTGPGTFGDAAPWAPTDAARDAPPDAPPGRLASYVVARISVPRSAGEATSAGLDLDGRPNDANAGIDNQLGTVFANLEALASGLSAHESTAAAVDRGRILVLADLVAYDLGTSTPASLVLGGGADPQPPACANASDEVCRRHLQGDATFARAGAPAAPLFGRIQNGRFTGGPGPFTLPLAFFDDVVVDVPLQRGRAELTGLSATEVGGGKLGGAIRKADYESLVIPAFHTGVTARYDLDCPPPRSPPSCHCTQGSSGATAQALFDRNDDCAITLAEVQEILLGLVTYDIDLDGDGVNDAVSIGVGVQGVRGSFPAP